MGITGRHGSKPWIRFQEHQAYLQLWDLIESAHIKIRGSLPPAEVQHLERDINAFRMRNAPFIDANDATLSSRYFEGVIRVATEVANSGSRDLAERYAATNTFTPAEISGLENLVNATSDLKTWRDQLVDRIRTVLKETSYAVDAHGANRPQSS